MSEPISRRSFIGLLSAGILAFVLWRFRSLDSGKILQEFFAFEDDIRAKARARFAALRRHNATLYQQSVLFFTLAHYRAGRLLPSSLREEVLYDWSNFLFSNRDLAWGYIGYPRVGDFQICNGLIRN